jgi:hypothetical protein
VPFFQTLRAELLLEAERADDAVIVLEDARARVARWGERWQEAEILRVEARTLAARNEDSSAIEARFGEALEVAREQGARGWELRAATDFASYLCRRGRADEARALLGPVLDAVPMAAGSDVARAEQVLALANEQLPVG